MATNVAGKLKAKHPNIEKLGRIGWLAKGIVYVLAGGLALVVVSNSFGISTGGAGSKEASPTGAFKTVAASRGGPIILIALGVGLFIYALWRLASAVLPGSTDAEGMATRAGYVVSAIMYSMFGATALSLAGSSDKEENGNRKVADITNSVMHHTAGRWLIGIAGLIVIGAGVYRFIKGFKAEVTDEVSTGGMSAPRKRWARRLGAVGEIGRGIAMGLIGFFLVRAAITFKASEATGMDGALRRLAHQPFGAFAVVIIGLAFIAYGLHCLTTFTRRRLVGPSS
ncbi:MAG: DUF1206 domain-containing protein [Actinomycetota bacterium]